MGTVVGSDGLFIEMNRYFETIQIGMRRTIQKKIDLHMRISFNQSMALFAVLPVL
jgi:hypothetical protein